MEKEKSFKKPLKKKRFRKEKLQKKVTNMLPKKEIHICPKRVKQSNTDNKNCYIRWRRTKRSGISNK